MHVYAVIAVQTLLLLFLQFGDAVLPSTFAARKACHAGSGFLMLHLRSEELEARLFVYSVVAVSLGMTWKLLPSWVPPFRFGEDYDAGITIYLLIVGAWGMMDLVPPHVIGNLELHIVFLMRIRTGHGMTGRAI